MKWEPTKEIVFTERRGSWDTNLGKVVLKFGLDANIYAAVPCHGEFVLTPDDLIEGLAELIPELKE